MSSSEEKDASNDNKFDDLDLDGDEETGSDSDIMEPDTTLESGTENTPTSGDDGRQIEESSPPFGYNDATQDQLYLKEGLEDDLDDLRHEVEHILRKKYDIRNAEIREFDTSIVQILLEGVSVDEIAESVVKNRGFDPKSEQ